MKSIPSYSSKIAEFLRQNETSSVHKPVRRKFKRRQVIAYFPYDVCMADLAFYNSSDYVYANGGVKYILVLVDVFSKMCYVEPMKDKNSLTTLMAFEKIFNRMPDIPTHLVTDVGTEFYNYNVQKLFGSLGVNHYSIRGSHKACVAERMIKTLKGRIQKYLWENNTKRYIDVLQDVVSSYNQTPHRSIGISPVSVNQENRARIFKKLYQKKLPQREPRLSIGDRVRIIREKNIFSKGYTRNWSIEIYEIVSANSKNGVDYYKVQDEFGNILPTQRYYYELNLVEENDS